jgi:hypothetical protein
MVGVGPDAATYVCAGVRSQIDHVLCDDYVVAMVGDARVLAGLSENDHRWLEVDLRREVDASVGPSRCVKLPLWELSKEEWQKFESESLAAAHTALRSVGANASHAQRLRAVEQAWEDVVTPWLTLKRETRAAQRAAAPGSGHKSAIERLRVERGRWEALLGAPMLSAKWRTGRTPLARQSETITAYT